MSEAWIQGAGALWHAVPLPEGWGPTRCGLNVPGAPNLLRDRLPPYADRCLACVADILLEAVLDAQWADDERCPWCFRRGVGTGEGVHQWACPAALAGARADGNTDGNTGQG